LEEKYYMRKFSILILLAMFISSISVFAQKDSKWFLGMYGGFNVLTSENAGAYFDSGHVGNLFQGQGFINAGYYFHPRAGVRLALDYSGNASAANYKESNKTFRPYTFSSLLGFADIIVNIGNVEVLKAFNTRFFAGAGAAGSFNFSRTNWDNPKYELVDAGKACFAFRYGLILEYIWKCGVGLGLELSHEWMTDEYNGLSVAGSFPFDMKFNCSLGVNYHF